MLLIMRLSPKACSWSILYSQLKTDYQRLSSTIIHTTDQCQSSLESARTLFTCHGWIHHEGTCVHSDEFLRLRVTGQSTSGSASVFGFVTHGQSLRFRHQWTKPIVSIDMNKVTHLTLYNCSNHFIVNTTQENTIVYFRNVH